MGPGKFLSLWVCIAVFEIVGTPFAYHKFAGGLETQFVGYFLDYRNVAIGVSSKRGKWLLDFLAEFRRNNFTIHMWRFSEFLGRLAFLCPSVAVGSPLYSWAAALDRSTVVKAPKLVILTCLFLEEQLPEKQFMLCCRWWLLCAGEDELMRVRLFHPRFARLYFGWELIAIWFGVLGVVFCLWFCFCWLGCLVVVLCWFCCSSRSVSLSPSHKRCEALHLSQ